MTERLRYLFSSQGVSLVSLAEGETVEFWVLAGGEAISSYLQASPLGEALIVVAEGYGMYYLPLTTGQ